MTTHVPKATCVVSAFIKRGEEAMTTLVDLSQDITALKPGLIALRRELHQQPELAFEEVWTDRKSVV